jgi:hypothetical protein
MWMNIYLGAKGILNISLRECVLNILFTLKIRDITLYPKYYIKFN